MTGTRGGLGTGHQGRTHALVELVDVAIAVDEVLGDLLVRGRDPDLLEVALELAGEVLGALVAKIGLAGEGLGDDALELVIHQRTDRARLRVLGVGDPAEHLVRVATRERQGAGGQLVEHDADREQVGARVDRLAADQLRRHVGRAAEQLAGHRQLLVIDDLGDAEVHQLEAAVVPDHHVLGLDVTVDDADLVCVTERDAQSVHDQRRQRGTRTPARVEPLAQRHAVDELGDEEALDRVLTRVVVDLEDVLVTQPGDCQRLASQPGPRLLARRHVRVQDLDRDLPVEDGVETAVDDRHPAVADLALDLVLVELGSDEAHCRGIFLYYKTPATGGPCRPPPGRKPEIHTGLRSLSWAAACAAALAGLGRIGPCSRPTGLRGTANRRPWPLMHSCPPRPRG